MEILSNSKSAVILTGAGVSTGSGIPDFRSPSGVYRKYDPYRTFNVEYFKMDPDYFYSFAYHELRKMFDKKPNPTHYMIAELERRGMIKAVITQNIDMLHEMAGSKNVVKLHGSLEYAVCMKCEARYELRKILMNLKVDENGKVEVPRCERCGGLIKPDVVFFGEPLPAIALEKAMQLSENADLMITMGTSLVVYPAASLPLITHRNGGKVVIVNLGKTDLDEIAFKKYEVDLVEFSSKILKLLEGKNECC